MKLSRIGVMLALFLVGSVVGEVDRVHAEPAGPADASDCAKLSEKAEACTERAEKKAVGMDRKLDKCSANCEKNRNRCDRNSHRQRAGARSCDERQTKCQDTCERRHTVEGRCADEIEQYETCAVAAAGRCRDQPACADEGRCGVDETTWACAATQAQHCLRSSTCATSGRCKYAKNACVAVETNQDCAATPMCQEKGLCMAQEGRCVEPSDAMCAASEACAQEGLCRLGPDRRCAALGREDCVKSLACTESGRCGAENGVCVDEAVALKRGFGLIDFEMSLFDAKAKAIQARMSKIRDKKSATLESIVKSGRAYKNKADVLFRLAEARMQEAKYQYLLAREKYEKALACYEEKRCTAEPQEPAKDLSTSLVYYRQISKEYPDYRRIDEVIYHLGRGALDTGKHKKDVQLQKEGVRRLSNLVQKYPKSRYVPQAHLALAEYFFENDSLFYAKTNYEKIVTNFKKHPIYNYALYKLGWVYFILTEFERTVSTFKKVLASLGAGGSAGKEKFRGHVSACLSFVERTEILER